MKLQVNVNAELVAKIDSYAKMLGVSRSALCAVFIGQGLAAYDKSFETLEKCGVAAAEMLKEQDKKQIEADENND